MAHVPSIQVRGDPHGNPAHEESPHLFFGIASREACKREHQHANLNTHLKLACPRSSNETTTCQAIELATMGTHSDPTHRWKLCSPQEALLLFIFAAMAIVGLCASATLRKKRILADKTAAEQAEGSVEVADKNESIGKPAEEQTVSGWGVIKKVLTSSLHRNEVTGSVVSEKSGKLKEEMEMMDDQGGPDGWENTTGLAVWQRRILMGERCQLPSFSGLILYDERGRPLRGSSNKDTIPHQVSKFLSP